MTRRPGRARSVAAGPVTAQDGMVTAEFAVALPAFVLVVVAALSGVAIVTAQLRCTDAAAIAARLAARGEASSLTWSAALAAAPRGSSLTIGGTASTVTATVHAQLAVPGLGGLLPSVALRASAVDAREPASLGDPVAQP